MSDGPIPQRDILAIARARGLVTDRHDYFQGPSDHLATLVRVVADMLLATASRVVEHSSGIGVNTWRVLAELAAEPGARAVDLERRLQLDRSTLSRTIQAIVADGLAQTIPGEGRSLHLFLTRRGLAVHEDLAPLAKRRQELILAGFSEQERQELFALLQKLLRNEASLRAHAQSVSSSRAPGATAPTGPG